MSEIGEGISAIAIVAKVPAKPISVRYRPVSP